MHFELQRADMWKRIAAAVLDLILLCVVATGMMVLMSLVTGYDGYVEKMEGYYVSYAEAYGIESFDITQDTYNSYTEEERARYDAAANALSEDKDVLRVYSMVLSLTVLNTTLAIFIAYLIMEFALPMILKNGQTLGKKIFALGVVRCDGVKVTPLMMFVRTVLGKFTVETMVPVMLIVMLLFNIVGIVGIVVIAALLIFQIVLLTVNRNRTVIHDAFAQTVVIDLPSQKIFDTAENLLAYKTKLAAERAAEADY